MISARSQVRPACMCLRQVTRVKNVARSYTHGNALNSLKLLNKHNYLEHGRRLKAVAMVHYYKHLFDNLPANISNKNLHVCAKTASFAIHGTQVDITRSSRDFGNVEMTSKQNDGQCGRLSTEALEALEEYGDLLMKKTSRPEALYILYEDVAGPGILTKALLKSGAKKIRIFEKKKVFLPKLDKLLQRYPETLALVQLCFYSIAKLNCLDKINLSTHIDEMFSGIAVKKWFESSPVIMVGILPPKVGSIFLRYLAAAVAEMGPPFHCGRVQLLLFVSHRDYLYMIAKPNDGLLKYRSFGVLCQIFFDFELLEKVNRDQFFPPDLKHPKKKLSSDDDDHMYFIRLTPKKNLLSVVSSPEQLPELYFFIKQHMMKRSDYVIAKLENWIPNCGPRLIQNGYTVFTRFGDLSSDKYVSLFNMFSSWPEYHYCSFRSAMIKSYELNEKHVYNEDE